MLVLNIGMPRSGTLWRYKLIRDLVIAGGGKDGVLIRKRYLLHPFFSGLNADINTLTAKRLLPAMVPTLFGERYTLNTHDYPRPITEKLLSSGHIRAIYGYRDPRDCILSILEYSRRAKPQYSTGFLEIKTVPQAVEFMQVYLHAYNLWTAAPNTLILKYEDMLDDFSGVIQKIIRHLNLEIPPQKLESVVQLYLPSQKSKAGEATHFQHGIAQRFKQEFDGAELAYMSETLGPFLEQMGYEV